MDLQASKLSVLEKILAVNNFSLLEKINAILDKETIVGYTTDGTPLTKSSYNKRLATAEAEIHKGEYYSQKEAENLSKKW